MPCDRASPIFFASVFKDRKRLSIAHLVQSPPNALAISRHCQSEGENDTCGSGWWVTGKNRCVERTRVVELQIGVGGKDSGQKADGAFVSLPVRHDEKLFKFLIL